LEEVTVGLHLLEVNVVGCLGFVWREVGQFVAGGVVDVLGCAVGEVSYVRAILDTKLGEVVPGGGGVGVENNTIVGRLIGLWVDVCSNVTTEMVFLLDESYGLALCCDLYRGVTNIVSHLVFGGDNRDTHVPPEPPPTTITSRSIVEGQPSERLWVTCAHTLAGCRTRVDAIHIERVEVRTDRMVDMQCLIASVERMVVIPLKVSQ
jgi:hypothetical protein